MKKNKIFTTKLNFSKDELQGNVQLTGAGIMLPSSYLDKNPASNFVGRRSLDSFGWHGNDPKFYNDVSSSDIIPKPEDFIEQPFRLLSATVVGGGSWKATDFSNTKVLKASMEKLNGKAVYKDHETDTDNWVGIINGVSWSSETTNGSVKVPAGIDGILALDSKTNPKVCRGILIGNLYSNSVTVVFDWKMSHDFENEWDFYNKVGTIGTDGQMIRRIVTAIQDYHETSLVWLGADPFSKAYNEDGTLKNIDVSAIYEFSKAGITKDRLFAEESEEVQNQMKTTSNFKIGCAFDKSFISLSRGDAKPLNINSKETQMKDLEKLFAVFMAVHGTALNLSKDSDITEDQFKACLQKLTLVSETEKATNTANATLVKAIQDKALEVFKKANPEATQVELDNFLTTHEFIATSELTEKSALASAMLETVENTRKEVERLYRVSLGDTAEDEGMLSLIAKAESKELNSLLVSYGGKVAGKFSGSCKSCGSKEISFQSSKREQEEETTPVNVKPMSLDALRNEFDNKTMNLGKSE